ncbi:hypothetical protein NUU61_009936 [Penicillium alfredii]|uniref:Uncharacterized protein n=1 Tax=Penicillium alfredii TaxID=1506179 RepID=A0A9W9EH07_9EURO|nr:uncharacterized protein NUU61_009936 [Penicillium alfredii]KAJ5081672.1 hypothetical protein NUU61_009936 [Penicillium alfredii]
MVSKNQSLQSVDLDNPEEVAQCLRRDQQLCWENRRPSNVAFRLPSAPSSFLDKVAWHLTPHSEIPKSLRSMRCESIIKGIRAYGQQTILNSDRGNEPWAQRDVAPTNEELETTLKVLGDLQRHGSISEISSSSPLSDVIVAVQNQLSLDSTERSKIYNMSRRFGDDGKPNPRQLRCYICRYCFSASEAHEFYPALCRPCGLFNLRCSERSLPEKLDLANKTALVTGGRINLGYHTALRLLRCGARVIVSSRYPADAAARYAKETDFGEWASRLKIVGADFRTAQDAFRLVYIVKDLLSTWATTSESASKQTLDILINNAAQTLTDPVKAEMRAISREEQLRHLPVTKALLAGGADQGYLPRVRGGLQASWIPSIENEQTPLQIDNKPSAPENESAKEITHKSLRSTNETDPDKSSWVQSLHEIPYEDLISAHSVNAFVPLILCRELLACMGTDDPASTINPQGFIVNVSSREGIFEDVPRSRSKAGHHVHTNMSKAAINMITETEAHSAWKRRRVTINSVDPGYMSAAPECQRDEGCPIGFDDGAARVLWPVAVSETGTGGQGQVVTGRFLKHFTDGVALTGRGYQ